MSGQRFAVAATLLLAVTTLAACDAGANPTGPTPTTATAATPSATAAPGFATEATHPDPNFDTGYVVQITSSGFHPAWLIAPCCQAVTWQNLTQSPVTVVFDAVTGGSLDPIPPGGVYRYVPSNIESIAYHAAGNASMKGVVQINQLPQ